MLSKEGLFEFEIESVLFFLRPIAFVDETMLYGMRSF
jgi:hypothetical protein